MKLLVVGGLGIWQAGAGCGGNVRVRALWMVLGVACAGGGKDPVDTDGTETDTDEETDTDVDASAAWQIVGEDLGGSLLSVTGRSADEVWTVGSDDGEGPLVFRYTPEGWSRLLTEASGDLWWVWLPPDAPGAAWAVGSGGQILTYDGSSWSSTVTEDDLTLFGVWGADTDEVWAVGGDITGSSDGAALFRWDGATWTRQTIPAEAAAVSALYKVWGSAADDVWVCGVDGLMMHFDGDDWTVMDSGTTRTLLTVAGEGTDVYAVGGTGNGEVVHWAGASWAVESPDFAPEFNGVSVRDGRVAAAGRLGAVWWRDEAGVWAADPRGRAGFSDLHATWVDPEGGVWGAGGSFSSLPLREGTLIYGGRRPLPTLPTD